MRHLPPIRRLAASALAVAFVATLGSGPADGAAQSSVSVSAWSQGGTGNVFDGFHIGLANRSHDSSLFASVSAGGGVATAVPVHSSVVPHRTVKPSRSWAYSTWNPCWDMFWDPWYGYVSSCDVGWWSPYWGYAYAPPGWWGPRHHPVRYGHRPHRFRSGVTLSIHIGWSSGWYDPWWPWYGYAYYPRYRTVYAPRVVIVQPPRSRWISPRPGYVYTAPTTGPDYKEHPGATPVRRTAGTTPATTRPGSSAAPAPSPDLRTRPETVRPGTSDAVPTTRGAPVRQPAATTRTRPSDAARGGSGPTTRSTPVPSTRSAPPAGTRSAPSAGSRPEPRAAPRGSAAPSRTPSAGARPVPSTRNQPATRPSPSTRGAPSTRNAPSRPSAPSARSAPSTSRSAPPARTAPQTRTAPSSGGGAPSARSAPSPSRGAPAARSAPSSSRSAPAARSAPSTRSSPPAASRSGSRPQTRRGGGGP